jgi:hypothetical protein
VAADSEVEDARSRLALGDLLLGRDLAAQLADVASGSDTLGQSVLTAPG